MHHRRTALFRCASGFTLVELLVVIFVIGILIAILLPSISSVRESGRKVQCLNNFRQVGVALHTYHTSLNTFPPGAMYWATGIDSSADCIGDGSSYYGGYGWTAAILQYAEADYISVDLVHDFSNMMPSSSCCPNLYCIDGPEGINNRKLVATNIPIYSCPSDPQQGELVIESNCAQVGSHPDDDGAFTNMAGVADSIDMGCSSFIPKQFPKNDGMMGNLRGCKMSSVKDGLSNTLMIGEITGGGPGSHAGFSWAFSVVLDTSEGINGPNTIPGSGTYPSNRWDTGFASYHPGGNHFLYGDGSAHFLSENIDHSILKPLTTRAGGELVSGGEY